MSIPRSRDLRNDLDGKLDTTDETMSDSMGGVMSDFQKLQVSSHSENSLTYHRKLNTVTFSKEVMVKTIPSCMDFLENDDTSSNSEEQVVVIRRESLKQEGETSPVITPSCVQLNHLPRPVAQRPLHPSLAAQHGSRQYFEDDWEPVTRPNTPCYYANFW